MVVAEIDKRNRVEGVCRVRRSVLIDGIVAVAVVGNDDAFVAVVESRGDGVTQHGVDGGDRLGDGFINARVSDHVAVGVVDDDEIVFLFGNSLAKRVANFEGGHFRFEVVGSDLRRRDEDSILARERRFTSAIEEECDMGILLRLGDVELLETFGREEFAERVGYVFLVKEDVHALVVRVVRSHAVVLEVRDDMHALFRHVLLRESDGHLLGAVVAVVAEDDDIALRNGSERFARLIDVNDRFDELVGDSLVVGFLYGLCHVGGRFALAVDHEVVRLTNAIPAFVTVHSIVTTDNGSNASGGVLKVLLRFTNESESALRVGVTSVHEAVEEDFGEVVFLCDVGETEDVAHLAVNTAVAEKSHEVDGLAIVTGVGEGVDDLRIGLDGAIGARLVDFDEVLVHDASSTDVEVSDFGVSHLSFRQSHGVAASDELAVRVSVFEAVPERCRHLSNDIALGTGTDAPTVTDDEYGFFHILSF